MVDCGMRHCQLHGLSLKTLIHVIKIFSRFQAKIIYAKEAKIPYAKEENIDS